MKSDEEIARIFEAYDATESIGSAAAIAGCDPKTVRRYVEARNAGRPLVGWSSRPRLTDAYLDKIEEWVDRSEGLIRADRVHARLAAMGFTGSERTTRRAVAEARARWSRGDRPGHRPWTAEPGLWLQFEWGQGPAVPGPYGDRRLTALFCARLAWSRFRVVIPCRDRALPTLVACLDTTLRALGGAPAYLLTRFRADAAQYRPELDAAGRYYGAQVRGCVRYDEWSHDRALPGIPVSAADWAPIAVDLSAWYPSFAALRAACAQFAERANGVGRPVPGPEATPYERLALERARLHPVPDVPYTVG
jgi:hypothetical protein